MNRGDSAQSKPFYVDVEVKENHNNADLKVFIRHVLAVQDPGMRFLRLMSGLETLGAKTAIDHLDTLSAKARRGDTSARAMLICLGGFENIRAYISPDLLTAWISEAQAKNSQMATILKNPSPQQRTFAAHGLNINKYLEDMPLGRRKSMARMHSRAMLDHLRYDRHPAVVILLLRNPRLVERDVVLMAASRPNSAEVLRLIAQSPRWSIRYEVRSALCLNPYTPPSVSLSFAPTLLAYDLKALAINQQIHPNLRQGVQELLGKRGIVKEPKKRKYRMSANVNWVDASLRHSLEDLGEKDLALALLEAQKARPEGEDTPPQKSRRYRSPYQVKTSALTFLEGLGDLEEKNRLEGVDEKKPDTKSDCLTAFTSGMGQNRASAKSAPKYDEDAQIEETLPGEEDPTVQAIAQWFMDNLGPIELVPVAETTHHDAAAEEPSEDELLPYKTRAAPVENPWNEDVNDAALDFLMNLGELTLVPVGQEEPE